MSIVHTKIPEVLQFQPQVFADDRGFFFEAYNDQKFAQDTGIVTNFVQDN
ncbi:MAG: dTDP-4-dehydrorhamnose 3,5-epimerase family protein, partial [Nostoc sp.]